MKNWVKRGNSYETEYNGNRRELSKYFNGNGYVTKKEVDEFDELFNKDYQYTYEMYLDEQRRNKKKKVILIMSLIMAVIIVIIIGFNLWLNGLNKYAIDYDFVNGMSEVAITDSGNDNKANGIKEIKIIESIGPFKVTTINENAFEDYLNIKVIHLPKSIVSLDDKAFYNAGSLEAIYVAEDNPNFVDVDGVLFDKAMTTLLFFPMSSKIKELNIPFSVKNIDLRIFESMPKNLIINYEGTINQWAAIKDSEWCSSEIRCSNGTTRASKITWSTNIDKIINVDLPSTYFEGVGLVFPSVDEMSLDNYIFCGWYNGSEKINRIPTNYHGDLQISFKYAKSNHMINSYFKEITTGTLADDEYLAGNIIIPEELKGLISEGKVGIRINAQLSIRSKANIMNSFQASSWISIKSNAFENKTITSKIANIKMNGGFFSKDEEVRITFNTLEEIKQYVSEIPVYVCINISSGTIYSFNLDITNFNYEFVYINK